MHNQKVKKLLNVSLSIMLVGFGLNASSTELGDKKAFSELRNDYVRVSLTNNPAEFGKVITDDYVMLQPNYNGPDTYGSDFHLQYRKSLRTLIKLEVEPILILSCGQDWAMEIGRENAVWSTKAEDVKTLARYFKLLNRNPDTGWKYARTVMGWDEKADMPPPAPEFVGISGYGTWVPRPQGEQAHALISDMGKGVKILSATGDIVTPMYDQMAPRDETTGEMTAVGPWGEMHGLDQYMAARKSSNYIMDDLRKIVEEVIVCEPGKTAFVWGQDVYSGVERDDGARWIGGGDFIYMQRFHDGKWKVGPHASSYGENDGDYGSEDNSH